MDKAFSGQQSTTILPEKNAVRWKKGVFALF
jgi:hypothetical protein